MIGLCSVKIHFFPSIFHLCSNCSMYALSMFCLCPALYVQCSVLRLLYVNVNSLPVMIHKETVQIPALLGCFDPLGSFGQELTLALQRRMVLWVVMIMMMLTMMMIESEHVR